MTALIEIASPCKQQCALRGDLCVSCHRTVNEIRDWTLMSIDQRRKILDELDTRAKCPECGKWNKCSLEEGRSIATCWCRNMPPIYYANDRCLCRTCYQAREAV